MRILLMNDRRSGGGGVETYLASLVHLLEDRGHDVALLHAGTGIESADGRIDVRDTWSTAETSLSDAFAAAASWCPDVAFSHNMRDLSVDEHAALRFPLVKMMHGYFGTCVSGQKAFSFPRVDPCSRRCGIACLALHIPRRCGTMLPSTLLSQYRWTMRQRALLPSYRAVVVASEHMRDEFEAHGVPSGRLHAIPLFTSDRAAPATATTSDVVYLGRMTRLKGPDVLLAACRDAAQRLGRTITLTLAGDGPLTAQLAGGARGVDVRLRGWVSAAERPALLAGAAVVAIPSRWPEPFGLVGLEAAAAGVPVIAFDVGGVSSWLRDDSNGLLVDPRSGAEGFGRALARLLGSPGDLARLGAGGRAEAERFAPVTHVRALERVLDGARRP